MDANAETPDLNFARLRLLTIRRVVWPRHFGRPVTHSDGATGASAGGGRDTYLEVPGRADGNTINPTPDSAGIFEDDGFKAP